MRLLPVELPAEERRRAGALLEDCEVLELPVGASLEGAELPPAVLFMVDRGRFAIVRGAPGSSRRILLALAAPGTCCCRRRPTTASTPSRTPG